MSAQKLGELDIQIEHTNNGVSCYPILMALFQLL